MRSIEIMASCTEHTGTGAEGMDVAVGSAPGAGAAALLGEAGLAALQGESGAIRSTESAEMRS